MTLDGAVAVGSLAVSSGLTFAALDAVNRSRVLRWHPEGLLSWYPALARDLRTVANDFGSRSEFAGIIAQKPALDLERQRAALPHAEAPPTPEGWQSELAAAREAQNANAYTLPSFVMKNSRP